PGACARRPLRPAAKDRHRQSQSSRRGGDRAGLARAGAVARVEPIAETQEGRPFALPWGTRQIAVGELCRLPLTGVRVRDDDFLAGCRRGLDLQLRLGRALEMIGRRERLGDVAPGREEAVVAQHEHWMVADAALQPLALVHVERDTFVIMVAAAVVEAHGPL